MLAISAAYSPASSTALALCTIASLSVMPSIATGSNACAAATAAGFCASSLQVCLVDAISCCNESFVLCSFSKSRCSCRLPLVEVSAPDPVVRPLPWPPTLRPSIDMRPDGVRNNSNGSGGFFRFALAACPLAPTASPATAAPATPTGPVVQLSATGAACTAVPARGAAPPPPGAGAQTPSSVRSRGDRHR